MAYQLKDSGLALEVVTCVMVDEDGESIVELGGNNVSVHENVTIGTGAWKGKTYKYFQTSGSSWSAYNVRVNSPYKEAGTQGDGLCLFAAVAGAGNGANNRVFASLGSVSAPNSTYGLARFGAGGPLRVSSGSSSPFGLGSTNLPTDMTTAFSIAGNIRTDSSKTYGMPYFGLEAGDIAADADVESVGDSAKTASILVNIGGTDSQGYQDAKFYIVVLFKRELTISELQSLHNDWFGTLIETGVEEPATISVAPKNFSLSIGGQQTITATRSEPAPAEGATYSVEVGNENVLQPSTDELVFGEGEDEKTFTLTALSPGSSTFTVIDDSDPDINDGGTVEVTATLKLKVLVDASAKGATGVSGIVFEEPAPGTIAGPEIGEFTDQAFEDELEDGKAVIKIPVTEFGGDMLSTEDAVAVCLRDDTHTTGIITQDVSIIEE